MSIPTSNVTSAEAGTPTNTDAKHPSSSQAEFIYVPEDFKVKEGAKLAENLYVGKALGVGLQVGNVALSVAPSEAQRSVCAYFRSVGSRVGWGVLTSRWQWQGRHKPGP